MATDCIPQVSFDFQGLPQPIVARLDQAQASSDGGAVLLKALHDRLGLEHSDAPHSRATSSEGRAQQARRRFTHRFTHEAGPETASPAGHEPDGLRTVRGRQVPECSRPPP
jgi:hypothetical protein